MKIPEIIYPYGLKPASFDRTTGPPFMKLVQISPEMAQKWLLSRYNRNIISRRKIDEFKKIIREGRWEITSDAISFLKDGRNYNGQHRLTAISEGDTTVAAWVMVGSDKKVAYATDSGNKKTPSHFLQMEGYAYSTQYAAVAKVAYYLNKREPMAAIGSGTLTTQQIIDNAEVLKSMNFESWLERYYTLWLHGGKKVAPYRIILGLGWYLYQKDKQLTTGFLHKLLTGVGIADELEPEYQARQRMLAIESTRSADCYSMMAIMAKAWLLRKENRIDVQLRVERDYFPNIWD